MAAADLAEGDMETVAAGWQPAGDLRAAVEAAGGTCTEAVYGRTRRLFQVCLEDASARHELLGAAPEYGRAEFLACLDATGRLAPAGAETIDDFRHTCAVEPGFDRWFQLVATPDGALALLPARWLCHLAGLRHPTVQLFIDLPGDVEQTLVQVRGLSRPAYPGCFDMPVAGHISGQAAPAAALWTEMAEELGLAPGDIADLRPLGHYDYYESAGLLHDREHRFVFRCRLVPGSLSRIRFVDAEVAAIAIFARPELDALLARFPERVASGLRASLPLYSAR